MQRVAAQVLDKKRMARDAQAFADEADDLLRFQMMEKKGAAYGVKTVVAKGKSQGITADAGIEFAKVRWSAVQDDRPHSDSRSGERPLRERGNVTFTAGDVHPGEFFQSALLRNAAEQSWTWCARRQTSG